MASIYQRGKRGGWYLTYYVNGRHIRKKVGRSKKLAELAKKEIEVKLVLHICEILAVSPKTGTSSTGTGKDYNHVCPHSAIGYWPPLPGLLFR